MRLLFLGDVVGKAGRTAVTERLPGLVADLKLDCVVINGGERRPWLRITEAIYEELCEAGADCITLGKTIPGTSARPSSSSTVPRAWSAGELSGRHAGAVAPSSSPPRTVRRSSWSMSWAASSWTPWTTPSPPSSARWRQPRSAASPMPSSSTSMPKRPARSRSWATSSTGASRSSSAPTTHVPTADHRVLPGGTAFQTDVGMCGDYDGVIGMDKAERCAGCARRRRAASSSPPVALRPSRGIIVDIGANGLATAVTAAARRRGPGADLNLFRKQQAEARCFPARLPVRQRTTRPAARQAREPFLERHLAGGRREDDHRHLHPRRPVETGGDDPRRPVERCLIEEAIRPSRRAVASRGTSRRRVGVVMAQPLRKR